MRKLSMAQWVQTLKRYKDRFEAAKLRGMEQAAKESIQLLRQRTVQAGAIVTGAFNAGWTWQRRGKSVAVINRAPHAGHVEWGRRPGQMPPIRDIVRWVELRFHVGGKRAWSMARAIARKIFKQGTEGRKILQGARPRMKLLLAKNVAKSVFEEWKRS